MKAVVNRVPLKPGRVELRQVSGQIYDLTRADEPTVIGDPLDQDLFARIQADIRDVTVRAGQSITAGDVVNVEGGEAYREVTAYDNVETIISSSSTSAISACRVTNDTYLMCSNTNGAGSASFRQTDGKGLYNLQLYTSAVSYTDCEALTEKLLALAYVKGNGYLYAKVASVNGNVLSGGTEVQISAASTSYCRLVALSATKFAAIYNRSGLKIRICTVNGTTITVGAEYALPGNTAASYISACLLASGKIGICFSGTNGYGQAVIATVSGTAVTFGVVATWNASQIYYSDCCVDGSDMIVAYVLASSNVGYAKVLPVSGTTIIGSQSACNVAATPCIYPQIKKVGDSIVMAYSVSNVSGQAVKLVRAGNTLIKQQDYKFNDGSANYLALATLDSNTFVGCYADQNHGQYGTATVLAVNGDQIAGSFEDTSQDAIALESGAPGQRIAVAKSGNVQLAGVKTGDRIDSPGVSAYAPLDGWLTVTAKEAPGCVTGVYKGDGKSGQSNPTVIDLGFCPSAVAVIAGEGGDNNRVPLMMVKGMTKLTTETDGTMGRSVNVTWTETGVEFYSDIYVGQFNQNGGTYYYIAWR